VTFDHPDEVVDAGLQSERTYLAWQRTGLSFAAVGGLFVHAALDKGWAFALFGVFGLVAGGLILARAQWRYRVTVAAVVRERSPAHPAVVAALAVGATVLCLGGLVALVAAAVP
jgi:uncharacterized membrane protein YidH (DUF202 family)